MLRAVLFDLDDTLFDHRHCAREALSAVHQSHMCFSAIPFDDFVRAHADHLESLHLQVLAGTLDLDAAREERFRRLFQLAGTDGAGAAAAAAFYRERYIAARRPIPGAPALLAGLRADARIAVISNNLLAEQREKMRQCGLDRHVDVLVVSEEVGKSKPDPAIFGVALDRLEVEASDALMIGDSWAADIEGARAAGIAAIWFNPGGLPAPDPTAAVPELRMLEPVGLAIETIHSSYRRANRN
jgi:HAD superfamily hydrolase (TIGR01509 family)